MEKELKKEVIAFVIYTLIALIFLIISIKNKNYEYVYYNLIMIVSFPIILILNKKLHLKFHIFLGLLALSVSHLAGGNILINQIPLYQNYFLSIHYDKIVHFLGSTIIALLVYNFLNPLLKKKEEKKPILILFLVFIITVGIGAMNEIIEFMAQILFDKTIVGDYKNNAMDLVINGAGALFASIFFLRHYKKEL